MMKWKKQLTYGCCTLLMVASLAACSGNSDLTASSSETNTVTNDESNTDSSVDNTTNSSDSSDATSTSASMVYGKVTAVNGTEITLALGDMPQGGGMGGKEPKGDKTDKGRPSGKMPGGEAPSGMPEAPNKDQKGGYSPSGETLTITIKDESIIQIQNGKETATGTLEDIVIDSMLTVQYADDGNISAIIVGNMSMGAPGDKSGDRPEDTSTSDSEVVKE